MQCWVHRFNVEAAHFGDGMLKRKPPGEGPCPTEEKFHFFKGVNMNEIGWNFCRRILIPWTNISTRIHSPGSPVLWASMQNLCVRVERLLQSVKQQKESDRSESDTLTGRQNSSTTIRKSRSGLPHSLLVRVIQAAFSLYCWVWSVPQSSGVRTAFSRYCRWRSSGLPSLATSESDQDCLLSLLQSLIRTVFSRYCWGRSVDDSEFAVASIGEGVQFARVRHTHLLTHLKFSGHFFWLSNLCNLDFVYSKSLLVSNPGPTLYIISYENLAVKHSHSLK